MKDIRALEPQLLVLEAITSNQWVITMYQMLKATSQTLHDHCFKVALITAHMSIFGNRQLLIDEGISPQSLVLGAFLHDIGYIGKGNTSACGKQLQSMSYMEQLAFDEHIQTGFEQVKKHTQDPVILDIISMHHEYLNGSGYPTGRTADTIPPHVRIVSIANALCSYLENTEHTSSEATPLLFAELLDFLQNEAVSGKYDLNLLTSFFNSIMSYYDSLIPLHEGLRDHCSRKEQELKSLLNQESQSPR